MNPPSSTPAPIIAPAPPLAFSLWALRKRMEDDPLIPLELLKQIGFTSVELSGLFNRNAEDLRKLLDRLGFKVCGLHGPTIDLNRSVDFHVNWAKKYASFFKTDTVGIESSPVIYGDVRKVYGGSAHEGVAKVVLEIARRLEEHNLRLSYHCFDHDFVTIEGKLVLQRLFEAKNVPANLGLQLDTLWIDFAGFDVTEILQLPIHSMHVGERTADGKCCCLGSDHKRCLNPAMKVIASGKAINWILENDSTERVDRMAHTEGVIQECLSHWPVFWESAHLDRKAEPLKANSTSPKQALKTSQSSKLVEKTQSLSELLTDQIEAATREHLFSETSFLPTLDYDDPRVKFYVHKREGDAVAVGSEANPFAVENAFLGKIWPNRRGKQLILVRGGGGSGKTTFLRFFFQFYLVYKERLEAELTKQSPPLSAAIYEKHAYQHVVLYADLRRAHSLDAGGLRAYLFKKLRESLRDTLADQGRPVDAIPVDVQLEQKNDEAWVTDCCDWIARLNVNGSRKWYVSWFLDNGDYLNEEEQKALVSIIKEFIPNSPTGAPNDPITDRKWMLWRVILPVRPETLENLSPLLSPLDADSDFNLGTIDFDDLHDKRGKLLHDEVSKSAMHVGLDRIMGGVKPYFDILPPDEIADAMEDAWRVVVTLRQGAKQIISAEARSIIVDLSHDSARRDIRLFARAALSHCFMMRYKRAEAEGWARPPLVSDYFLFHGLLCGKSNCFEPEVEGIPILNVFALDLDTKTASPHSIMIGPHSLYLLSQGQSWKNVRIELSLIGYDSSDIKKIERKLLNKEILKAQFNGEFFTKLPIAKGLWRLVSEDAYIDVIAVACANAWHNHALGTPTDPLDTSKVVLRFSASVALLKKLWWAEEAVFNYTPQLSSQCGDFPRFAAKVRELNLPSIAHRVVSIYRQRIGKLPDYDAPAEAIRRDRETWNNCIKTLDELEGLSNKPSMSATQR